MAKRLLTFVCCLFFAGFFCTQSWAQDQPCPQGDNHVRPFDPATIVASLFLIGDAGEPSSQDEPVLLALKTHLREAVYRLDQDKVGVVFLGDNVYPAGLPKPKPGRDDLTWKLEAQVAVFEPEPGNPNGGQPFGIFVPGNHDWAHNSSSGWDRIRRQASFIEEYSKGKAVMLPKGGCPGPTVRDVGVKLRLIALDTQWWLRGPPKPMGKAGGCPAGDEEEVTEQLADQLRQAREQGMVAVVIGHHPLITGGPHSGRGNPLRRLGFYPQDITARKYRCLKKELTDAFQDDPPLVYAAGHDHGLQLLNGEGFPFQVVSGGGSSQKVSGGGCSQKKTRTRALEETVFCHQGVGFVRLDVSEKGEVRIAFLAVSDKSNEKAEEVFSAYLKSE